MFTQRGTARWGTEDSEARRPGVREGSLHRSHKSKGTVGGREANLREPGGLWERLWGMGTWDFDFVSSSPKGQLSFS